jgi:type IV pilus assembly protein PilY1
MINRLLSAALVLSLAMPIHSGAGSVPLASAPLASATTGDVLPNLMFVIDNSGSMDWDYLPDWVPNNYCKTDNYNYTTNCDGEPPFFANAYNGIYYDPKVVYLPPFNADGTTKNSQTSANTAAWTSVKNDAYNIQSTGSINLITKYPDTEWCTDSTYTDCLRNDNYVLPGTVTTGSPATAKYYGTKHSGIYATGSGQIATGMPDAATSASRSWGPYYYDIIPGEYCDSARLTNCQKTQNTTFSYPARVRWCNTTANAMASAPTTGAASAPTTPLCQALKTTTYKYPRYPTIFNPGTSTPATKASSNITIERASSTATNTVFNSVKVNGYEILSSPTSNDNSRSGAADEIANRINACTSAITGSCTISGYSATVNNRTVTVYAPTSLGAITFTPVVGKAVGTGNLYATTTAFSGFVAATSTPSNYSGYFQRIDIVPGQTYPKDIARTDCLGSSCTYDEEMTNFANWWTYYHTRMQTMKTATSRAFKPIDTRFRVGFIDINGTNYVDIAKFDATTKSTWYTKLFSINPTTSTPLRSGLSRVGQIFAGKKPSVYTAGNKSGTAISAKDPMQYACQQNFTLLTTDGYWNSDSNSDVKKINGTDNMTDQDSNSSDRPFYEGPTASAASLADAAKYYYDTDLRTTSLDNCTGSARTDGTTGDVCEDLVFVSPTDNNRKQHMTTFTLGLGVDGTLVYQNDYSTATAGDFAEIKAGTRNWPVPVSGNETTVDDLWHAAVNGRGTYFSAKNPTQLATGLSDALSQIGSKIGAGAAAATSTLNPVAGDNFAYVASYTTQKWTGNLEARSINITTGTISESASWCVEDVIAQSCTTPSSIVADTTGSSTIYNCVTPSATSATCPAPGVLVGTECKVEVQTSCTGTLKSKVSNSSDSRSIYMNVSGTLQPFTYSNLTSASLDTNFKSPFLASNLSQWSSLTASQQNDAKEGNLVNFLRGQTGFENRASNSVDKRVFRLREAVLGDAVESKPAFISKPTFSYTDPRYADFKSSNATRAGTVYIGTNDGMLHAFNSTDGTERWAFVPTPVIQNMWKLADNNYANIHSYYVNGAPVISDICSANCTSDTTAVWKTILVGGLNGGGRGYYALDITNPATPTLLWEFTASNDANLGFTYGNPVVTKMADGTWVALFTSGYNNGTGSGKYTSASTPVEIANSPAGDGKGYLFILNASSGAVIKKISTGSTVGTSTTPSGLAKINSWADDSEKNNTSTYTYAGDLLGNVWRFETNPPDPLQPVSGANDIPSPTLFATLYSNTAGTATQPITTRPELGLVSGKRMVFVGTGKYLETSDLNSTQQQTLYGITDPDATTTLVNPRNSLVQQTLTTSGATRTLSNNGVNLETGRGWFIDFSDNSTAAERQNTDSRLEMGTLIVPTTVPSNTLCSPGGHGWINYLNFQTGAPVDTNTGLASLMTNAPVVGINVIYVGGKPKVSVVTSDHPTPDIVPGIGFAQSSGGFQKKRVIWREMPH